jgi:hypothetical protein
MLTRTKDDQQYAVVTGILPGKGGGGGRNASHQPTYKVKCFGKLARVGPWERTCTFPQLHSLRKGGGSHGQSITNGSYVLIGYNYQDNKRGAILCAYTADEARKLAEDAACAELSGDGLYDVPPDMFKHMREHGVISVADGSNAAAAYI